MNVPLRPQDTTSEVIAKWNRDYFNPRYAMACLCHEYLVEFPYSPRYAIYLVDLGITGPDGQRMPLRNDIFNTTPEGLSRIDVFDQLEPGSLRKLRLGRRTFLAPHAQEPRQLGGRVRFEPMGPSRERRPSSEGTYRRRSRSGDRERQPFFTPVPGAAWGSPSPAWDHWSSGATTNPPRIPPIPPLIYRDYYGRSRSQRYLRGRQSESRRTRYPVRHMEQSSPPEATPPPVPVPSASDILLHYSPPPSARRSADSTSSSSTNPRHGISRGSVREQFWQPKQPGSSRSYSHPTQSYATDPYYPLSDPVGRHSNAERQESHSSRDSFHTASPPHPLLPTLAHPQTVIQDPGFTDNNRNGRPGSQSSWGHQQDAWNASAEPRHGSGRHDSYYESMPPPSLPPPPLATLEVERRAESVSAPQAMVNISPLVGQWQRDEMSLRILLGEYPLSTSQYR